MLETALENWTTGIQLVSQMNVLVSIVIGVAMGLIFGAIPGLTAVLAMVLLLPLTYGMDPVQGFSILMGAYVGGITGGLVAATMIGVPGTPASIATTFDAYPMAQRGEGGRALAIGFGASFFGGLLGWLILIFLTPQLGRFARTIGQLDYTAIIIFGFAVVTVTASKNLSKGLLMTCIGATVAAIGTDPLHGTSRLTFGTNALQGGFGMVPLLAGVYVVSRALEEAESITDRYISPPSSASRAFSRLKEVLLSWKNLIRSSVIGIGIGILPGIGAAVAPFVSYDRAKKAVAKSGKKPEYEFGKGNPDGIVASEACNNASIGGALVPGLALGIPGDVPIVILLSGFILQGFQPGPLFFSENLDLVYSIYVSYFIANLAMIIIGLTVGVRFFSRVMSVPKVYLIPIILIGGIIGSYNVGYSMTDVWVSVLAGLFAYLAKKADYPLTPFVIAIILGPMLEYRLRVGMNVHQGDVTAFLRQPVALVFLALTVLSVGASMWNRAREGSKPDSSA